MVIIKWVDACKALEWYLAPGTGLIIFVVIICLSIIQSTNGFWAQAFPTCYALLSHCSGTDELSCFSSSSCGCWGFFSVASFLVSSSPPVPEIPSPKTLPRRKFQLILWDKLKTPFLLFWINLLLVATRTKRPVNLNDKQWENCKNTQEISYTIPPIYKDHYFPIEEI